MDVVLKYFSDFTETQIRQLEQLKPLYEEWNAKINVISRKDMDHFYEHHVLHSLTIAAAFEFTPGAEIIDIGTGGGFPGVPLAIFFPEVKFHLVDSINKKLKVIEAVKEATGLANITTQHTRAEEIKNRKFDYAVSRAVAPLGDLWRWSKPLVKKGLICLKGGDLAQEIHDSGLKPKMMEIAQIFAEPYFEGKYLLHTAK